MHPCILIVKVDSISTHSVYRLSEEEHLGQFLCVENYFYELNLYTLLLQTESRKEEEEVYEVEILDLL